MATSNKEAQLGATEPIAQIKSVIVVPPAFQMIGVLGAGDELLKVIEQQFPTTRITARGNEIQLSGDAESIGLIENLISEMLTVLRTGQGLTPEAVERSISWLREKSDVRPHEVLTANILSNRGKSIRAKTLNQKRYVDAIDQHTIVFGIGPAGTGKTYLAVAKAVQALQEKRINRIVLTRPAVEAGERLGFLRPLYDALHDMIEPEKIPRLMTSGTIEVAPLAYMRGRTLNDAFIILDEAQNTSPEQMKMFLTRLGFGSTMVITGDVTQVDLPRGTSSGLQVVKEILQGVDDVAFCNLSSTDVVRHKLVAKIVDAYSAYDERRNLNPKDSN